MNTKLLQNTQEMLQGGSFYWIKPCVDYIECISRHSALYWCLECVETYITDEQKIYQQDWLKQLEPLKLHLSGIQKMEVQEIQPLSKYLFNSYQMRLNSQIILSKIYAAEGAFITGNYDNYERSIAEIFWKLNDTESKFINYLSDFGTFCLNVFDKYVNLLESET